MPDNPPPLTQVTRPRMSRTERIARQNFSRDWYVLEQMDLDLESMRAKLPEDWHLVEHDLDLSEPKQKVTLYLDRSVARTFKAMGKGHQGVMNRVLRSWMQAKAAQMLELEGRLKRRQDRVMSLHAEARRIERPVWDQGVEEWDG